MRLLQSALFTGALSVTGFSFLCATAQNAPLKALPLAPTPIMGWSSWNHYGKKVTDADVKANADALVSSGLAKLGYVYVNVDGSWEGQRDATGLLKPNPAKFTDMKALGDYIHARGLKYGVYSSPGPFTCGGFVASFDHEEQDARMFADWGADYLKYDLCTFHKKMDEVEAAHGGDHQAGVDAEIAAYKHMDEALKKTGRPMYYTLCQYGLDYVWKWGPSVGATMYRTTKDIKDNWDSMMYNGTAQAGLAKYVTPGHNMDPDSLEIGNGGMKPDEYRVQMSLWSILAAPLILGNDVSHMDQQTLEILSNTEVIAIDQDPLVQAGERIWNEGSLQVWARPLKGGAKAVLLINGNTGIARMSFRLADINWTGPAHPRDVWAHRDLPTITDKYTVDIPRHAAVLLVLKK